MTKIIEGTFVDSTKIFKTKISFDEDSGKIINLAANEDADYCFDDSHLIFPVFGDVHVHAREDVSQKQTYKEDFLSCSMAALNGGLGFICDMPNNPIPPCNDDTYQGKEELTSKSLVSVLLYAGIGKVTSPLNKHVPYKVFMSEAPFAFIEEAVSNYHGKTVCFHCEDFTVLSKNRDQETHEKRRPPEAESVAIERAIELIKKYDLDGRICHVSTKEGLQKILAAGIKCEVTPHHLYFCQEDLIGVRQTFLQVNPPIRQRSDRDFLRAALNLGQIDYLASDHAPHTFEEKKSGLSGVPGLDTYGSFCTWLLDENKTNPLIIAKMCAENPAKFFKQFKHIQGQGKIEVGEYASFTVLNLRNKNYVNKLGIRSKCSWSPFEGLSFPGKVQTVFLEGKKVF